MASGSAGEQATSLSTAPRAPAGFVNGLVMGFTHIVPDGIDHVLFVLGLFLLSRKASAVLLQVTAFTVAHSITLGLEPVRCRSRRRRQSSNR